MNRARLHAHPARLVLGLCCAWAVGSRVPAADPPQGLVLHYGFEQAPAANGTLADKSSLHNDGRVTGAKWTAAGKQGGAMEFAANKDFIAVANHGSLNPKHLTLAVWFKTATSDAVTRRLIDKRAGRGYALSIAGDSRNPMSRGRLAFVINGRHVCLSDSVLADESWHQGTAVFDGKDMRLYVDGVLQKKTTPCPEEIASNLDDLTIGMNRTTPDEQEKNRSFEGTLDEIMIFNRALSSDEIRGLLGAVPSTAAKPAFTKQQVAGRLRQLKLLYEEGLLTEKFYNEKVAECEDVAEDTAPAPNSNAPAKPAK